MLYTYLWNECFRMFSTNPIDIHRSRSVQSEGKKNRFQRSSPDRNKKKKHAFKYKMPISVK